MLKDTQEEDNAPRPAALEMDPSRYWHHITGMDCSDADKLALLEAVWAILVAFVVTGVKIPDAQSLLQAFDKNANPLKEHEEAAHEQV